MKIPNKDCASVLAVIASETGIQFLGRLEEENTGLSKGALPIDAERACDALVRFWGKIGEFKKGFPKDCVYGQLLLYGGGPKCAKKLSRQALKLSVCYYSKDKVELVKLTFNKEAIRAMALPDVKWVLGHK